jgi:SAM-dependent methyltransferase
LPHENGLIVQGTKEEPFVEDNGERSAAWHGVWNDRDDERADWNGFEQCFESIAHYEQWIRHIAAMLTMELSLRSNDVVADLGCGTGRFATLVAPRVKHVFAFDYALAPIRVATTFRQLPNITYKVADMTTLHPVTLGASKAYAVGSLFYLNSVEDVFSLIRRFVESGASFGAVDLPDRHTTSPSRQRSYDTSVYSHLDFDADQLQSEFPGTRIVRDEYAGYANAKLRFHAFIPSQ